MFWEPTWEGRILAMMSFKGQEYTLVLSHPLSFFTKRALAERAKRPTLLSHTSTFGTSAKEAIITPLNCQDCIYPSKGCINGVNSSIGKNPSLQHSLVSSNFIKIETFLSKRGQKVFCKNTEEL